MIDEARIREVVNRYIHLEEVRGGRWTKQILHLTNGHGDNVLTAGPQTSLLAHRNQLEHTLMTLVKDVLHCDHCDTEDCFQKDDDLCMVIQVMGS